MESSFGKLFRTSRLASYDRRIPQVYTSYGANARATGSWGLKRDMPLGLRTKLVNVHALDTREQQADFSSAQSRVLHIRRWRELFSERAKPIAPEPVIRANISSMSADEWKRFLKAAAERRKEWNQVQENGTFDTFALHKFLGVRSVPPEVSDHVQTGSEFYHHTPTRAEGCVKGRYLSNTHGSGGITAGFGGYVGHVVVPQRSANYLQTREVQLFYLRSARLRGTRPGANIEVGGHRENMSYHRPAASTIPRAGANRFSALDAKYSQRPRLGSLAASSLSGATENSPAATEFRREQQARTDLLLGRIKPGYSTPAAEAAEWDGADFDANAALQNIRDSISGSSGFQAGSQERPQASNVRQTPFGVSTDPKKPSKV
ncbi:hypothetical protein IWQ60_011699 [Tieghemiomyces parasiticus]|uniref:Mitochondrial ribosomal protein MRP51 n=1 Tax=Tieghemiomyces parasiticus TaxID=78921 RepID=A0A9W7ZRG7_9FUNG|nr:hypothetical protein IWQ60_011699 [Tieghemiomyces parasiticus]